MTAVATGNDDDGRRLAIVLALLAANLRRLGLSKREARQIAWGRIRNRRKWGE